MLDKLIEFFFGKEQTVNENPKPCCPPPKSRLRTNGCCGGCGQHESSHAAYKPEDKTDSKDDMRVN